VSGVRLEFKGLAELKQQLRNLPANLAAEAGRITEASANAAAVAIRTAYPTGPTGNLKSGVTVTRFEKGKLAAGSIVKNTAKHATIFEVGTQARHYFTKKGKKKSVGKMPPGRVFVPIAIEKRRQMYEQLVAMLERNGLKVSGRG
jgi:hypothetical protein